MKNLYFFGLILLIIASCQSRKADPTPVDVVSDSSKVTEPVQDETLTDTSKIELAPGFEKLLISRGVDPVSTPDGFVRYQHIKDIDTLIIYDFVDMESKTLKGIEGFTNLKYFYTVSIGVEEIDFSKNAKLDFFTYMKWAHCMGCGSLEKIKFGEHSALKSLYLYDADKLVDLDFENLLDLRTLVAFGTREIGDIDLTNCAKIEEINSTVNVKLGLHKNLREMIGATRGVPLDLAGLPALEKLDYRSNGKMKLDFSVDNEIKELNLNHLLAEQVDVSGCKQLKSLTIYGGGDWTQTSLDLRKNSHLTNCILKGTNLSRICVSSLTGFDFRNWQTDSHTELVVCE